MDISSTSDGRKEHPGVQSSLIPTRALLPAASPPTRDPAAACHPQARCPKHHGADAVQTWAEKSAPLPCTQRPSSNTSPDNKTKASLPTRPCPTDLPTQPSSEKILEELLLHFTLIPEKQVLLLSSFPIYHQMPFAIFPAMPGKATPRQGQTENYCFSLNALNPRSVKHKSHGLNRKVSSSTQI